MAARAAHNCSRLTSARSSSCWCRAAMPCNTSVARSGSAWARNCRRTLCSELASRRCACVAAAAAVERR
eukprot:scaffold90855_cov69-Phaeocystis_antarctica.AAC.4